MARGSLAALPSCARADLDARRNVRRNPANCADARPARRLTVEATVEVLTAWAGPGFPVR
jgi:hypothetical protein